MFGLSSGDSLGRFSKERSCGFVLHNWFVCEIMFGLSSSSEASRALKLGAEDRLRPLDDKTFKSFPYTFDSGNRLIERYLAPTALFPSTNGGILDRTGLGLGKKWTPRLTLL